MSKRKLSTKAVDGVRDDESRIALIAEMQDMALSKPALEPVLKRLARVGELHEVTAYIESLKKYRARVNKSAAV